MSTDPFEWDTTPKTKSDSDPHSPTLPGISSPATVPAEKKNKSGVLACAKSRGPTITLTPEEERNSWESRMCQLRLDAFFNLTDLSKRVAWEWNRTNLKWASRYSDRKTFPSELLVSEQVKLGRVVAVLDHEIKNPPPEWETEQLTKAILKLARRRGRYHAIAITLDNRGRSDRLHSNNGVTTPSTGRGLDTGSCGICSSETKAPRSPGQPTSKQGLVGG